MLGLSLADVVLRKEALIWKSIGGGKDSALASDALKHTADAFDLLSHVERQLGDGRRAALLSFQAFKFYNMSGAISSLVRVGEDVAEDLLVELDDPWEARRFLEQALLPAIRDHRLFGHALSVRCQYAFVLARCGEPMRAAELLRSLEPYLPDAGERAQQKVAELREFIGAVEEQMRQLPSVRPPRNAGGARRSRHLRPGRNDPCPCGSGRKYKGCCGRS